MCLKLMKKPAYTDVGKFKEDRSTLCKFRISAHSLEIEKGRYYNIPRENRVCLHQCMQVFSLILNTF
jgi:hypothetical protein